MSTLHDHSSYEAVDGERAARTRAYDPEELNQLVRAAAQGDEAAWTTLVRRFTRRLTGLARAHRLGVHDVDDVVQSTFVRLFMSLHSLRDPGALPAWLDTTARRESLRVIRRGARERPMDEHLAAGLTAEERDDAPLGEHCRTELARAMAGLAERQRALLLALHADEEPSYNVISRTLAMPVGSIGPTRARALDRLRRDERLAAAAAALALYV